MAMRRFVLLSFILLTLMSCKTAKMTPVNGTPYALVIHGGAGTIRKEQMTPERETAYHQGLKEALIAGETILKNGGSALDAVEAAVIVLENNPLFNAGKGAVFTSDGKNELDASIMRGDNLAAGAVGGLTLIKNPIKAARAVMEKSDHVLLTGQGAQTFATQHGLELVDPDYFFTKERWEALQKAKEQEIPDPDTKKGTVGAVARDQNGLIAAATSTGGMTNKRYQRLGDTPIIGAGTYADNRTCGISSTGHGEYFIRLAVAHDIHAQMLYANKSMAAAAHKTIQQDLTRLGGDGGVIGVDYKGNIIMEFNSAGMYRGYAIPGKQYTAIYKE